MLCASSQRLGCPLLLLVGLANAVHPEPPQPLQVSVLLHLKDLGVEQLSVLRVLGEGEGVARHGRPRPNLKTCSHKLELNN